MKNSNAVAKETLRRIPLIARTAALALALMLSPAQLAQAGNITPPPVPTAIAVPAGNVAFLVGHAIGTQNYVCLPSGSGFAFKLFTPQATLFKNTDKHAPSTGCASSGDVGTQAFVPYTADYFFYEADGD